jgi:hypothetical protein
MGKPGNILAEMTEKEKTTMWLKCYSWKGRRMRKQELRKKLASLSFEEKIRLLEKLRDRTLSISKAGLRKKKEEERPERHR